MKIRCVLHGSFRKHWQEIMKVREMFTAAGIEVIAPEEATITKEVNGFVFLESDANQDQRLVELKYLHNIKLLGSEGFSYFVNPEGYIGKSASYELGIAQVTNTRCFFMEPLKDHPAYCPGNTVWKPELLTEYVMENKCLPEEKVVQDEIMIHKLWSDLMVPGSVVAVGGIIEFEEKNEKEILLVKTHKWGNRFSVVGGKVRRNELLKDALLREVAEETGLKGKVDRHLCTFDQIKSSGYYQLGIQHIFVDNVVKVESKKVHLNEEAEDYIWIPVRHALRYLDLEPNARHTLELYAV